LVRLAEPEAEYRFQGLLHVAIPALRIECEERGQPAAESLRVSVGGESHGLPLPELAQPQVHRHLFVEWPSELG